MTGVLPKIRLNAYAQIADLQLGGGVASIEIMCEIPFADIISVFLESFQRIRRC